MAQFVIWLFEQGYEATDGDAYDTDGDGGHMKGSTHQDRMANDKNIFYQGKYLDGKDIKPGGKGEWQADHWAIIGSKWKSMSPICAWGGDFGATTGRTDYNHFSFEHAGKR